jgi:hypothetical protein
MFAAPIGWWLVGFHDLAHNGVPCTPFGFPLGPPPRVSSGCVPDTGEAKPGDRICE